MSHTIHVVFPCQEGKGADLLGILNEILGDTRAFDGCESIEVYTNSDNPDTVILWEKFETRAHRPRPVRRPVRRYFAAKLSDRVDCSKPSGMAPDVAYR